MRIKHHEYQLRLRHGSGFQPRQGALLQIDFGPGLRGYADCHPWPSLGDPPLQAQLAALQQGLPTPLLRRSLHYARLDAEARQQQVSLFDSLQIPPSHFLIANLIYEEIPIGFTIVKVKLGSNLPSEVPRLKELMAQYKVRFRLDFNEKISQQDYLHTLKQLDSHLDRIDFCEDPFPYDPAAWQKVQATTGIALAADRQSEQALAYPDSCQVLIVKPAIQDPAPFVKRPIVMTSYMDHALGQLCAAYEAAKANISMPCGLLTHLVYAEDPFFNQLSHRQGILMPARGTGFGFDKELAQLNWIDI